MKEPQTVQVDKDHKCVLHTTHAPRPKVLHIHHIIPLAMQKETGVDIPDEGNTALVCPTGHYNVHQIIEMMLRGRISRGRKGVTGQFAERAVAFYKEKRG